MNKPTSRRYRALTIAILLAAAAVPAPRLLAVQPGNRTGVDPYPAAVWVASQGNVVGPAGTIDILDAVGSGSLIAPDLILTAAHNFRNQGPNFNATIGVGNGNGTNRTGKGTIHPNWGSPTSGPNVPAPGTPGDLAVIRLATPVTTVTPLPLLIRSPRVDDTAYFAGYGGTHVQPKGWSGPPQDNIMAPISPWDIDAVSTEFTYAQPQEAGASEAFTEGGDSGGPQIIDGLLEFGFGFEFVASALQGNMQTSPSGVLGETHTRADRQATASGGASNVSNVKFIHDAMPNPTSILIKHNLPADPTTLAPTDPVGVYIEAIYPVGTRPSYVFSPLLFEDDFDLFLTTKNYTGDTEFGPDNFLDDLAGYGFDAGVLGGLADRVIGYDFVPAAALLPFDEAGNPLDPPLDWVLDFNSSLLQFDLTNNLAPAGHMVMSATLPELQALALTAQLQFAAGLAVPAMFVMAVPEPATVLLAALALAAAAQRRWSKSRSRTT